MITIIDSAACCGCTACVNICPVQCIVMRRDCEGFDYPLANPDRCIGCGKCESVCPVLEPLESRSPLAVMGGRSDEFVEESASGGVFPHVARRVIGNGGVVFGAAVEEDMTVAHCEAGSMDEVNRFRGPKYVQSELYAAFEDVHDRLCDGMDVLFSGTPCQVAGLRKYLDKKAHGLDLSALVTVDFACHGVPGPGLWEKYAGSMERAYGSGMTGVRFRDKKRSWFHYDVVYEFACSADGSSVTRDDGACSSSVRRKYVEDPYMALFVQDMTLRPSCYKCPVRCGRSGSDLTLADLWSVRLSMPRLDDDRGASLVLVNTEKGRRMLEGLVLEELVPELAMGNNGGFSESVPIPVRRKEFFDGLDSACDLQSYMSGFVRRVPLSKRIVRAVRAALVGLKRRIIR